jgi:HEAT repeat protein
MKGWYRILLATLAVATAASLLWQVLGAHEAVYRGKTLSSWLDQYYARLQGGKSLPTQDEILWDDTAVAIRQIGTNGVPYLLKLLATEDSGAKRAILNHFPFSRTVLERLGLEKRFIRWASRSVVDPMKASLGFRVLGPSARNAIPELVRIMRTSRNHNGRRAAAYSLGFVGPTARQAIPPLLENLKDPDNSVRDASVRAVFDLAFDHGTGLFRPEWSRVMVPLLAQLLTDPKTDALRVIQLLSGIGPDAKAALPAIRQFVSDPNPRIASAAKTACERIAPTGAVQNPIP